MTLATSNPDSLIAALDRGRTALAEARDDFDRLRIRDSAAAAVAAAKILERRDIQNTAQWLVIRAELAIAEANPAQEEKRNRFTGPVEVDSESTSTLPKDTLYQMRTAASAISDEALDALEAKSIADPERYPAPTRSSLLQEAQKQRKMGGQAPHLSQGEGNEGWYTPMPFLDVVRETMGGIDLDPASHPHAQTRVKATNFFTKDDDGLAQVWRGRVFLNPPYTGGLVDQFADKLIAEVVAGNVTEAVWLTNNSADTGWFHRLVKHMAVVVFLRGRVRFWGVDDQGQETVGSPLQGQVFGYIGPHVERFANACAQRESTNGYISRHWRGTYGQP